MSSIRLWADRQRASGGYGRWIARTDVPLMGLALAFLGLLVVPLVEPDLSAGWRRTLTVASATIWQVFLVNYLVRLYLSEHRAQFVRRNVLDLVIIAVPMLRPLRALRLRVLRLLAFAGRVGGASRRSLHARVAAYVSVLAVVTLFVAAAAMLLADRNEPDGNISSFRTRCGGRRRRSPRLATASSFR